MLGFMYPLVNQIAMVTSIKTPYATGVLKLFKQAITFLPGLAAADFTAIEANFTGYAAKTLTTLPAAYPDYVHGGASFTVPTQQWNVGTPFVTGNDIYGGWIENAGGDLLMAWQIASGYPMQAAGQALALELSFNFFGDNQVFGSINGVPL